MKLLKYLLNAAIALTLVSAPILEAEAKSRSSSSSWGSSSRSSGSSWGSSSSSSSSSSKSSGSSSSSSSSSKSSGSSSPSSSSSGSSGWGSSSSSKSTPSSSLSGTSQTTPKSEPVIVKPSTPSTGTSSGWGSSSKPSTPNITSSTPTPPTSVKPSTPTSGTTATGSGWGSSSKPNTTISNAAPAVAKPTPYTPQTMKVKGWTPSTSTWDKGPVKAGSVGTQSKSTLAAESLRKEREQYKPKTPPVAVNAPSTLKTTYGSSSNKSAYNLNTYSPSRHYNDRDYSMRQRNWNPPQYAYQSHSSFGMWDAMMLWMILDSVNDANTAQWMRANANDPGIQAWRQEAEKLSAENAEIKAKLANMDAAVKDLNEKNVPVAVGALPAGLTAAALIAPEAAAVLTENDPVPMKIGTGSTGGNYYAFCAGNSEKKIPGLKKAAGETMTISCQETNGSVDNIDGLKNGTYDAVLVQSNILNAKGGKIAVGAEYGTTLYFEVAHLLANDRSGVDSVDDLNKKHIVYLIDGGAVSLWEDMVKVRKTLADIETRKVSSSAETLEILSKNNNAVGLYISGMNSPFLNSANKSYGNTLHLASIDNWSMDNKTDADGNKVYWFVDIPGGTYNKLQDGFLFTSTETLAVSAVFLVSEKWVEQYGERGTQAIEKALWGTKNEMVAAVNP